MNQPGMFSLARCLEAASQGAVLTGQLFPLSVSAPLRVTYNWLYSALNCDPNDQSGFNWVLNKIGSGLQVSLSPQQPYSGMTLYASVRPDLSYTVQVQAPYSADWITAVAADETLTLAEQGFLTLALQGLNGSYLSVDGTETSHDGHSGYLLHSNAGSVGSSSTFFLSVSQAYQDLGIPLARDLDVNRIVAELAARGASDPQALARVILSPRG